jgi:HK97 family phage major capsid protein
MAQKAVSEGVSLDEFRGNLLLDLSKQKPLPTADIGMSDREAQAFSFVRAINALANPQDRKAQEAAKFEFEASAAAAQKAGKQARGIMVPYDVMRRDLITGTGTGTAKGGNLIATDLLAGSFIDVLRNKMVLQQLGATFLTGLQGNVAIPKKTTASTSYWVAENVAPTEGAMVFGQVTMTPKTLAAYVDFSRRLSIQSSLDVENLVRNDLASGIAVAVDAAALGASPTSGPVGLRGTSGIGSVAIGTNGGAPTWASIVNLIKEVEIDNALTGAASFLTNPKVKAKMMATPKQASGVEGNFLLGPPYDSLAGYPVVVSNQVTSTLTKGSANGVCSAMFFGVWSDLMVGQWSGVDLLVDPYTGSSAGTTRVTAFIDLDIAVRYPESFAAVLDYTTT